MKALPYLYFTLTKNRIKDFFKRPANWIVTLLMAGLLGLTIFSGGIEIRDNYRPMNELYAIVSLMYIALFIITAYRGVNRGTTLFSLADIHMLFPAPIKGQKILLYGLVKQMGTSLTLGVFLLFQYSWIHQQYGMPFSFLLLVILGYGLTLFLGQLTAMVLYSFLSAHEGKRLRAKAVLFALCGMAAVYVLIPILKDTSNWLLTGADQLSRLPMLLFPVGGWLRGMVVGLWEGQWTPVFWAVAAILLWTGTGIALLSRERTDYYEDVLKSTETAHQALTARREGKTQEMLPENIKTGKTGIGRGLGAAVYYYKHRLESRRGRRFLLDTMSMVMLLLSLFFAFVMRGEGFLMPFASATYMQLFTVSTGRWVKELTRPYIYLVPEPPFKKLLHCLRESMLGYLAEAVLLMIPMGLITGLGPFEIVLAIVTRFTFACLFTVGNLLIEKMFSGVRSKMMVMILYFGVMILLTLPGIILAILAISAGFLPMTENVALMTVMSAVNFVLSLPILFLCRNILDNPEWSNPV